MDKLSKIDLHIPKSTSPLWQYGTLIGIVVLAIVYFSIGAWYKQTYGQFTTKPESIASLLTIRRSVLGQIDKLFPMNTSVCTSIINKVGPYAIIPTIQVRVGDPAAIVNWRPLTVRLTGHLGGIHTARDGVFDMDKGVQLALWQGARAFIFDIDYLEDAPCQPVIVHRDPGGYMRSLHTGSIKEGCQSLANRAFESNYDPVLVIVYIRRLPTGNNQKDLFFKKIAASLNPLSVYHLGSNEQGDYHNCKNEGNLFTSSITNFQKKFIVLTNYNTTLLPTTQNPKDNLDFWTNARIYQDPSGLSSTLGSVTGPVPSGQMAYATVGESQQLLKIPSNSQADYKDKTSNTFHISMTDVEYTYTHNDLLMLIDNLGIQCIPMDVVALSALKEHENTIKIRDTIPSGMTALQSLSVAINPKDPLSYWAKAGWGRKFIITGTEGFENPIPVLPPTPVPGYIIPNPVIAKKPPPSTNSNGGLVNIA